MTAFEVGLWRVEAMRIVDGGIERVRYSYEVLRPLIARHESDTVSTGHEVRRLARSTELLELIV